MKATHPEFAAEIAREAGRLGFNRFGVIAPEPARRLEAYLRWLAAGMHGEMAYLARPDRVARRRDLNVILPGVRSVLVVGLDYYTGDLPAAIAADPSRGRISNYAWNLDYHDVMLPRLEALAEWLRRRSGGHEVTSRAYVDTGAILERDHGETAGLGFTGKNTMLIDPRRGSWFFLGVVLTTMAIDKDPALARAGAHKGAPLQSLTNMAIDNDPVLAAEKTRLPTCGRCRRCLDACPTAAFPEPYVLDARRCISYLTIELKGWIPTELRPLMGNWVYGCDVCQAVCPFNRFATPLDEPAFRPSSWDATAPALIDLLELDEEQFQRRFGHSPIRRITRVRLVRNACVAAGNWGNPLAVPVLSRLLSDPEPIIRGHAAWALQRVGNDAARRALATAREGEADEQVRRELVGNG